MISFGLQVEESLFIILLVKTLKKSSFAGMLYMGMFRIIFILFFIPTSLLAHEQKILASIKPLQSIIANLTKNLNNQVDLIIDNNESLHNYHLKPTKMKNLYSADYLIIIDRDFELFLNKILTNLKDKKIIEVAKLPGVQLIDAEECDHHDHEHEEEHHHHHSMHDYHIWLDIDNVKSIAKELVKIFIQQDKNKEKIYQANLAEFLIKLDELDKNIKTKLMNLKGKNFIVTHNAYQYFVNRYNLENPKAITIDHDHNIGAKTFLELQKAIKSNKVECIFEEPQFESHIINKLKENSKVKVAKLDAEWGPSNAKLEDVYFALMNELSNSFAECLK